MLATLKKPYTRLYLDQHHHSIWNHKTTLNLRFILNSLRNIKNFMNEFESRQRIEFCHLFPLAEKLISLQLFLSIYCPLWLLLIKFVSPSQKEVVIAVRCKNKKNES